MTHSKIVRWAIILGAGLFLIWHFISPFQYADSAESYANYLVSSIYSYKVSNDQEITERILYNIKVYLITVVFSYGLFSAIDSFFLKKPDQKTRKIRRGFSLPAYIFSSIILGALFHFLLAGIFVLPWFGSGNSVTLIHHLMALSVPTVTAFVLLWPLKRNNSKNDYRAAQTGATQKYSTLKAVFINICISAAIIFALLITNAYEIQLAGSPHPTAAFIGGLLGSMLPIFVVLMFISLIRRALKPVEVKE